MSEAIAITAPLTSAQIVARVAGVSPSDLANVRAGNAPIGQPTGPALIIAHGMAEAAVVIGIRPRQSPFTY